MNIRSTILIYTLSIALLQPSFAMQTPPTKPISSHANSKVAAPKKQTAPSSSTSFHSTKPQQQDSAVSVPKHNPVATVQEFESTMSKIRDTESQQIVMLNNLHQANKDAQRATVESILQDALDMMAAESNTTPSTSFDTSSTFSNTQWNNNIAVDDPQAITSSYASHDLQLDLLYDELFAQLSDPSLHKDAARMGRVGTTYMRSIFRRTVHNPLASRLFESPSCQGDLLLDEHIFHYMRAAQNALSASSPLKKNAYKAEAQLALWHVARLLGCMSTAQVILTDYALHHAFTELEARLLDSTNGQGLVPTVKLVLNPVLLIFDLTKAHQSPWFSWLQTWESELQYAAAPGQIIDELGVWVVDPQSGLLVQQDLTKPSLTPMENNPLDAAHLYAQDPYLLDPTISSPFGILFSHMDDTCGLVSDYLQFRADMLPDKDAPVGEIMSSGAHAASGSVTEMAWSSTLDNMTNPGFMGMGSESLSQTAFEGVPDTTGGCGSGTGGSDGGSLACKLWTSKVSDDGHGITPPQKCEPHPAMIDWPINPAQTFQTQGGGGNPSMPVGASQGFVTNTLFANSCPASAADDNPMGSDTGDDPSVDDTSNDNGDEGGNDDPGKAKDPNSDSDDNGNPKKGSDTDSISGGAPSNSGKKEVPIKSPTQEKLDQYNQQAKGQWLKNKEKVYQAYENHTGKKLTPEQIAAADKEVETALSGATMSVKPKKGGGVEGGSASIDVDENGDMIEGSGSIEWNAPVVLGDGEAALGRTDAEIQVHEAGHIALGKLMGQEGWNHHEHHEIMEGAGYRCTSEQDGCSSQCTGAQSMWNIFNDCAPQPEKLDNKAQDMCNGPNPDPVDCGDGTTSANAQALSGLGTTPDPNHPGKFTGIPCASGGNVIDLSNIFSSVGGGVIDPVEQHILHLPDRERRFEHHAVDKKDMNHQRSLQHHRSKVPAHRAAPRKYGD